MGPKGKGIGTTACIEQNKKSEERQDWGNWGSLGNVGSVLCLLPETPYGHKRLLPQRQKKTLLLRVVVAFVAFLCPLFLYQNAAVLYLNVELALFANFGNQTFMIRDRDFRWLSQKTFIPQERVFFGTLTEFLVAPKSIWISWDKRL